MAKIIGGWDLPEVAAAQHALVVKELTEDAITPVGPYAAFRWAMDTIGLEYGSLLDVGCGCGHYAVLCERFYLHVHYHGTDVSDPMTVYARQLAPLSTFSVCEFRDNQFDDYDIILASQVLEQLDFPFDALDMLLLRARQYIILNRIRLTPDVSHRITEATYSENMGRNWLWNLDELVRFIEVRAEVLARKDWSTDQTTIVIKV